MRRIFAKTLGVWVGLAILTLTAPASAERVLYLGDSLSMGAFGKTLDESLRASGHEVFTYVTGGATPYYWLSLYAPMTCTIGHWERTPSSDVRKRYVKAVPKVETLLERHRPDVTIVQTGVNLYASLRSKRRSKEDNVREVRTLVENMCKTIRKAGSQVYWIAPPDSHTARYPRDLQDEMLAITKSVVGKYGILFESGRVTRFTDPYPKTDGIHYGPTEARAWGHNVASHFVGWSRQRQPAAPTLVASAGQPHPAIADGSIVIPKAIPVSPAPPVAQPVHMAPKAEPVTHVAAAASTSPAPVAAAPEEPEPDLEPIAIIKRANPTDYPSGVVDVRMRLLRKTKLPHASEISYQKALAIYEWEIIGVRAGYYPHRVIRVAHPVYWNGRPTAAARFEVGKEWSLELAFLSKYPTVEQLQTFDDLEIDLEMPVYIAKM